MEGRNRRSNQYLVEARVSFQTSLPFLQTIVPLNTRRANCSSLTKPFSRTNYTQRDDLMSSREKEAERDKFVNFKYDYRNLGGSLQERGRGRGRRWQQQQKRQSQSNYFQELLRFFPRFPSILSLSLSLDTLSYRLVLLSKPCSHLFSLLSYFNDST